MICNEMQARSPFQPLQHHRRPVRDDNRSTRSQNPLERLESHVLHVEHARLGRSMDHGELAADLVRCNRHVLPDLLRVAYDVEVCTRRLDLYHPHQNRTHTIE